MDKQTLSNYGWLTIVTLILAIMLAFATPFGNYVGDAVVSVANGFVGASDAAIDKDNIGKVEDQWDSKFDYSGFDDKINKIEKIPEGMKYYRYINARFDDSTLNYDEEIIFNVGDDFPEPQTYDLIIYNGWSYMYNAYCREMYSETAVDTNLNAWTLICENPIDFLGYKVTDYPLNNINGKNVELWNTKLCGDGNCIAYIDKFFKIPQTATTLYNFDSYWCVDTTSVTLELTIPKTVVDITNANIISAVYNNSKVLFKYDGTIEEFKSIKGYSSCKGTIIQCKNGVLCLGCDENIGDNLVCDDCSSNSSGGSTAKCSHMNFNPNCTNGEHQWHDCDAANGIMEFCDYCGTDLEESVVCIHCNKSKLYTYTCPDCWEIIL